MVLNNKYEVLAMYPDFEIDFKELVSKEAMEYYCIFLSEDDAKIALEEGLEDKKRLIPILPSGDIVSNPIDFIFSEKTVGSTHYDSLVLYGFPKNKVDGRTVIIDRNDCVHDIDRVPELTPFEDICESEVIAPCYAICRINTDSFEITENDNFSFGEYTDPYANLLK